MIPKLPYFHDLNIVLFCQELVLNISLGVASTSLLGSLLTTWPLMAPGRFERNLREVIITLILMIGG